jgi:hypothetical protein
MNRLLTAFCAFALTASASAEALDPLLTNDRLWEQSPEGFMEAGSRNGFVWGSKVHDSARAIRPNMQIFGLAVSEVLVHFEGGKTKDFLFTIYARGLPPDLTETAFRSLVANAMQSVSAATGLKPTPRAKDADNAVKADGLVWQDARNRYLLEYSFTREVKTRGQPFRPEFVRLEVTPASKSSTLATAAPTKPERTKFVGTTHVQRDPATGDVWIGDVPMINQGAHGYSILACSERLMRYYGFDVDKQELAQASNASFESNLSYAVIIDSLKKIGTRQKFRVREIDRYESGEFRRLLTDYNRVAKRVSVPLLNDPQGRWSPNDYYPVLRLEVWKEVKTKNKGDVNRFWRQIQASVAEGVPPLWCLILGLVPEPNMTRGEVIGASRLIIGYNERTQEVIFTDSWGIGHEMKRMALADAWTVTTDLLAIEPL